MQKWKTIPKFWIVWLFFQIHFEPLRMRNCLKQCIDTCSNHKEMPESSLSSLMQVTEEVYFIWMSGKTFHPLKTLYLDRQNQLCFSQLFLYTQSMQSFCKKKYQSSKFSLQWHGVLASTAEIHESCGGNVKVSFSPWLASKSNLVWQASRDNIHIFLTSKATTHDQLEVMKLLITEVQTLSRELFGC